MYRLQRNVVVWASLFLVSFMSASTMTQASDIYFSEYSEPANAKWYNRYVEIYNASGASIDLLDYALLWCENKCANNVKYNKVIYFTTGDRYLADGATYTVSVNNGNKDILIKNATVALGMANNNYKINGNDPIALVKKAATWNGTNFKNQIKHYTVLDVIGKPKTVTTDFTGVCGSNTLATVVLIKKPAKQGNTSWANSKGTSASDCDWTVKAATDYSNVGQHTVSSGDTTVPVITLTGNQIVEVALNASYSDAGATASDDTDGNITSSISTGGGTINTSVAGTYAVTYNVNDAASNAAVQIVRTVIVDPWNFNNSKQGWSGKAGASVAAGATYATLTLTGPGKNFPNFDSSTSANINTAAGKYVAITLKNNSANTKYAMAVMVGTSPKFAATLTNQSTSDADFKTVYFDMKTATAAANWTGTIQQVRFRPTKVDGSTGVAAGTIFIDKIAVVPVKDTTAPTVSAVSIASNNASSTVAGVGNVVTLTMTANEMIKTPVVTFKSGGAAVSDTSVTYTNTSGDTWMAAYTVESGDTAGTVSYSIAFNDTSANSGTAVTSGSGSVSMDAPPTITKSIVSAVNDGVTALGSVSANETVTWAISGSGVSISSSGVVTLDSAANYLIAASHSFTITATDSVGNAASTSALSVSVVDTTAPTITSGIVSSVNDGDTVLGSMSSNETVSWSISGSGVSISSSGAVTLDSAANAGSATSHSFAITGTDGSGNATTTGTLSVSVVDTTDPVISLVGSAVVSIELGTAYSDAGATATDNKDGSITSSITTVSDVDVNKVGAYTVTYNVSDVAGNAATQVTRTINVGGDKTIPVISLVGSSSVDVERTNAYSDLGATASDNFDGTITSNIVTVSSVDTTTSGTYTVTYDVNDAAGNAAVKVTRVVTVTDTTPPGLTVASLKLNVSDGATALGNVSADESVIWSLTGSGVSISTSGSVTLDSPADYLLRTSYSFEITATDAYGNFRRIPVIVVVDDITAPSFDYSGLVTSINDGGTALGSVSANEPVTWSISGSGVSISSEGAITLDSPANYVEAQSYQYRVTATDKQGGAGRAGYNFIVEVIDITPPTFDYNGLLGTIYEGTTALGSIAANEPVNWSVSGSGVSISSSGVVTLDSPASYETANFHKFRISATDKQGGAGRAGYFWTAEVKDNSSVSIDLDGNNKKDALTDGLLLVRGMFGLDGVPLVKGTIGSNATYTSSADIERRISMLGELADIDGNGVVDALTDGQLTLRYLFGLEGDVLVKDVVAPDATRSTAEIEAHLKAVIDLTQ